MKRIGGIFMCLILVSGFANCGKKSDSAASGSSTSTESRVYGPAPDGYMLITNLDKSKQIKLTMAGWEGGPSETDNVNKALETFSKYYPNITVEYTPSADGGRVNHHGKIMTMYAAGTAPDVFYCGSSYYDEMASKGLLYDITDRYFEVYTKDDYIPAALDCMTYNDRLYGISSCTVSPELYYNKDLFDQAGIPYPPNDPAKPWTWAQFIEAGKRLTKKDASGKVTQYGFYGLEDNDMAAAYFNQFDIQYVNADKTKFTATDDPNFKKIFQNIKELRTVHGIAPQAAFTQTSGMNAVQMLLTGMVAMFVEGSWGMEETVESGVRFGVAPLPVMDGAHSGTWGQAHMHSIVANTKHIDEAWALLVFLGSETYQIDLIKEGLWMPNRTSLYTEEGKKRWLTSNHPDGFADYAVYFRDYAKISPLAVMGNEAENIYTEEIESYFNGDANLDNVISNMRRRIDAVYAKK